MLPQRVDIVMVMVSDMSRSVRFYRDTLGFNCRMESPYWTEFDLGGQTLALHPTDTPGEPYRPDHQPAGSLQLCFKVSDISAAAADLTAKGASFAVEPCEREGEGIKLAVFTDPDGMPISLYEPT